MDPLSSFDGTLPLCFDIPVTKEEKTEDIALDLLNEQKWSVTSNFARLCLFTVALGRGYQSIFFEMPLTKLLGEDHALTRPVTVGFGVVFVLAALSGLIASQKRKWAAVPLVLASLQLMAIAVMSFMIKSYRWPELIEYASQYMMPLILIALAVCPGRCAKCCPASLLFVIKLTIAGTFVGHGMYALDVFPVPDSFLVMLKSLFGMEEKVARQFLFIAGVLDVIVAIVIFIPKTRVWGLWYAAAWGFATALARICAHIDFDDGELLPSVHRWAHETVMRFPNGGLPILGLLYLRAAKV